MTDRPGIPLVFCVTGANRHDSVVFEELIDDLPAVRSLPGRPRCWPERLHADKGYDFHRCRKHLKRHGIHDCIARLEAFSKLRVHFERSIQNHLALFSLACSVNCVRSLPESC